MTASALYTGFIRHRRLEQGSQPGEFKHPVAFGYFDIDELPELLGGRLMRRAPGVVRVRRGDLLGGKSDTRPVRQALREVIEERTGRPAPTGPIRVLTAPRTFGTCFNPVSFYYCFDRDEQLDTVVAEVTSTPWLERHAYVLRSKDDERILRGEHQKVLHVSPFQDMDHRHVWAVTAPEQTLSVHIENHRTADAGGRDFDATLNLERIPLSASSLRRVTARYPMAALRTIGLIYGHAIALKLRGAEHFRPPAKSTASPIPTPNPTRSR